MTRICLLLWLVARALAADVVYRKSFPDPPGTTYPEWTGGGYSWTANAAGTVAAGSGTQPVASTESANGKRRFLGEFGGPAILTAAPYDARHFVRVDQAVRLTLGKLPRHARLTVSFDLYALKSWDGNNSIYGPDRWSLKVVGGATLLDSTFSNNFKTGADLSPQNYPASGSAPQTGAAAANTLGYRFFGDSTYHLTFTFAHTGESLVLEFASSLFEGKGAADESWGLDNVEVRTAGPGLRPCNIVRLKATPPSRSGL